MFEFRIILYTVLVRLGMQIAVQLYSLRNAGWSFSETIERVSAAGFSGVEFAGLPDEPPEQVENICSKNEVAAVSAHVPLSTIEREPTVIQEYQQLGVTEFVIPYLEPKAFDPDTFTVTMDRLAAANQQIEDAGGTLSYHNHEHELETIGTYTILERLLSETALSLQLDVGWATAAGCDPIELCNQYRNRLTSIHLKDVRLDETAPRGGTPVGLGEGDVALTDILQAVPVEQVIFEHDDPKDPAEALVDAGDWFRPM